MSLRLFGTDGMRGRAGAYPLDRPTVTALGREMALHLGAGEASPTVVLGGDTRLSTPSLCVWLAEGLGAGGAAVRYAGMLPTPGVAWLVRQLGASGGMAVSASHNPHLDNGIKLFDGDGYKWPSAEEQRLERKLPGPSTAEPQEGTLPLLCPEAGLVGRYVEALEESLSGPRPLSGLRVALDCANGAAAPFAEPLFRRLGAQVAVIGDAPNGRNINLGCGSTEPEGLAALTAAEGAALGIAFDGDADRAVFADETGTVRDGDAALYLWATQLHTEGRLEPPRIVATSMSNLGLERALDGAGIAVVRCDVGDRVVVETMRRDGAVLGGEQSGHLIHHGLSTTGDGLLTALQLAAMVHRSGRRLSDLLAPFRRYPQVLLNVPVASKPDLAGLPAVVAAAARVTETLGTDGRLVLRYSGTEPLARVMIEGPEKSLISTLAEELAEAIRDEIGVATEA
ncbi:MAG: phosphoglucosamine mutase [Thermoanaerobaculia bacterium]